jgi:hypothetical protein
MSRKAIFMTLFLVMALAGIANATGIDDTTYVYVLGGQSNMEGRGDPFWLAQNRPELIHVPANVELWRWGPETGVLERHFHFDVFTYFGPEVTFAQTISKRPGKHIIVKVAEGNTSLAVDWLSRQGRLYFTLLDCVSQAVHGRKVTYGGLIWMQGESDRFAGRGAPYAKRLDSLIADLREDLNAPDMKFVVGQVSSPYDEGWLVAQAQANVGARNANAVCVSTLGLTKWEEGIHYDSQGLLKLGKRFAGQL